MVRRVDTAATNKWLQDPIPDAPNASDVAGGGQPSNTYSSNVALANLSHLNGRLRAVHQEINSIKQGFIVAQNTVVTRNGASSSQTNISMLTSSSAGTCPQGISPHRPLVLGMPVVRLFITGVAHLAGDSETDNMDTCSEMRKRKRQLALTSTDAPMEDNSTSVVIRETGVSNLGQLVSGWGEII